MNRLIVYVSGKGAATATRLRIQVHYKVIIFGDQLYTYLIWSYRPRMSMALNGSIFIAQIDNMGIFNREVPIFRKLGRELVRRIWIY